MFYVTLNLRVRMQYFTTSSAFLELSTCGAATLCLCQFGFRSDSKRYKPAQHTTTGWRTYQDSTTQNLYTLQGPLGQCVLSRACLKATSLTRQVGSHPLANNVKHSPSYLWFHEGYQAVQEECLAFFGERERPNLAVVLVV